MSSNIGCTQCTIEFVFVLCQYWIAVFERIRIRRQSKFPHSPLSPISPPQMGLFREVIFLHFQLSFVTAAQEKELRNGNCFFFLSFNHHDDDGGRGDWENEAHVVMRRDVTWRRRAKWQRQQQRQHQSNDGRETNMHFVTMYCTVNLWNGTIRASRKQNKTQLTSKFLQLEEPTHSDWDCYHHSSVLRVLHCIVLQALTDLLRARTHTHTGAYCVPLGLAIKSREGRNQWLEGNKALDAGCGFIVPFFLLSPLRLAFMVHQSTLDITKSTEKAAVYQWGEITVLIFILWYSPL